MPKAGKKRDRRAQQAGAAAAKPADRGLPAGAADSGTARPATAGTPASKVSALQQKAKAKLAGAHFRYLNEQLYTSSAQAAGRMVHAQPSLFDAYHAGFREQVSKWPAKPVDIIAKYINEQLKLTGSHAVADIGCGDAELADLLKARTHSFDLVSRSPKVTAANMTSLPLPEQAVDAAVFCLALMGTDYAAGVVEALRVLKPTGTLLIAEVKSRFVGTAIKEMRTFLKALGFAAPQQLHDNTMFFVWACKRAKSTPDTSRAIRLAPALKACQYKKR